MKKQIILTIIALLTVSISAMAQSTQTFTVKGVSFKMVDVEGGSYSFSICGMPNSGTLSSFSIGQTEVTQELWKAVMGNKPSKFKGDKRPVENVSWNDCQKFLKKLNEITGKHFRLPTSAEWQYAARGGNKSKGYNYSGSDNLYEVAWYHKPSLNPGNIGNGDETHPVASLRPNELGLYDMSGNVWEWCQDTYWMDGSMYYACGGGWDSEAKDCQLTSANASVNAGKSDFKINMIGLRLAHNSSLNYSSNNKIKTIEFIYENPTNAQIDKWISTYKIACEDYLFGRINELKRYNNPEQMLDNDLCLVYLLLTSKSISDQKERQHWFDLYPKMSHEQIYNLYNILLKERYKLNEINERYDKKQKEIEEKRRQLNNK